MKMLSKYFLVQNVCAVSVISLCLNNTHPPTHKNLLNRFPQVCVCVCVWAVASRESSVASVLLHNSDARTWTMSDLRDVQFEQTP